MRGLSPSSFLCVLGCLVFCLTAPAYAQSAQAPPASTQDTPSPSLVSTLTKLFRAAVLGEVAPIDQSYLARYSDLTLVTDDNVEKTLAADGAEDQVWAILVNARPTLSVNAHLDAQLEAARLASKREGLEHVKWGMMPYETEWKTCTRWLVFRPNYLVIASKGGKTLRYITPALRPLDAGPLVDYMAAGAWRDLPVWESSLAPGQPRAWIIDQYILAAEYVYASTTKVPKVAWLLVSGAVAKLLLGWMHRPGPVAPPARVGGKQVGDIARAHVRAGRAAAAGGAGAGAPAGTGKRETRKSR